MFVRNISGAVFEVGFDEVARLKETSETYEFFDKDPSVKVVEEAIEEEEVITPKAKK